MQVEWLNNNLTAVSNKRWIIVLLLAVLFLIPFIRLGDYDLRKDECLWAIRAKDAYLNGHWMDQTDHAYDDFWTSSYPPLTIWTMALSYKVFGVSEFATRFGSAMFHGGTIILVFLLGRIVFNARAGIVSALVMGLNFKMVDFARRAEMEATYIFFIVLAILLYVLHRKRVSKPTITPQLVGCGAAFGMALMSKIIVGFFVPMILAPYFLYLLITKREKLSLLVQEGLVICLVGALVAGPWHIYMYVVHGNEFIIQYLYHSIRRSAEAIEGHTSGWGALFSFNVLLNIMPIIIWLSVVGVIRLAKSAFSKPRLVDKNRFDVLLVIWVMVTFAVCTLVKTKISKYTMPTMIPLGLIAGYSIDCILRKKISLRVVAVVMFLVLSTVVWWQHHPGQRAMELLISRVFSTPEPSRIEEMSELLVPGAAAVALAILCYVAFRLMRTRENARRYIVQGFIAVAVIGVMMRGMSLIGERTADPWRQVLPHLPPRNSYEKILVVGQWRETAQIFYYLNLYNRTNASRAGCEILYASEGKTTEDVAGLLREGPALLLVANELPLGKEFLGADIADGATVLKRTEPLTLMFADNRAGSDGAFP